MAKTLVDFILPEDYDRYNELLNMAQEAKANADFLILIIHGGHETYELPSPRMKKLYRWFIDLGVDAVIGHHTHCYSGSEVYKNKPIVYSLGNFIFDSKIRDASWNYGVFAVLSLSADRVIIELVPFETPIVSINFMA